MLYSAVPKIHLPKINRGLLLLAGGMTLGGAYLFKKWKEANNMRKNSPAKNPADMDPGCPFGTMESQNGEQISLKSVSVKGDINGLLFSSVISQEYKNETEKTLEIIYTFPLGWDTVLLGMDATIGDKKLHGEVVQKAEAEKKYEDAIEKGDAAIMLQKSGTGLYTANLGNIKPQETVTVELRCSKLLNFDQGQIRLSIPTVIGERYGNPYVPGGLASHESAKVDENASYAFNLEISLRGVSEDALECPSHKTTLERLGDIIKLKLDSGAVLDRDFVLLIKDQTAQSAALFAPDEDAWVTLASFCPQMKDVDDNPIGLKILVDCSGSMNGMSIAQARKGLRKILNLLKENDFVSYSCFGSDIKHLNRTMQACDAETLKKISAAIDKTSADMGGTQMESAIRSTVQDIQAASDAPPVMLLITDGNIWDVKNLIEYAKSSGHRIFVIGVGAAPAESVLKDLAARTGGACDFVTPNENMAEAIVRMFHRMRGKSVRNIRIDWQQAPIWQAKLPSFIYDGETIHTFALLSVKPDKAPVLSWEINDKTHTATAAELMESTDTSLVRTGRMRQLEECPTDQEKLAIALKYQLLCDLTSFILVYERGEGDKTEGLPTIQQVPQMPAYGHGNYIRNITAGAAFSGMPGFLYNCSMDLKAFNFAAPQLHEIKENPIPDSDSQFPYATSLLKLWDDLKLQLTDFNGFIAQAERQSELKSLVEKVSSMAADAGIDKEAFWAALMELFLDMEKELDRHSMRLLHASLKNEDKTRIQELLKQKFPYFNF